MHVTGIPRILDFIFSIARNTIVNVLWKLRSYNDARAIFIKRRKGGGTIGGTTAADAVFNVIKIDKRRAMIIIAEEENFGVA